MGRPPLHCGGLGNLHLYQNSSNLRIAPLKLVEDLGGQLAQFCSDGAVVGAKRQYVPLKSDNPAGIPQRRRDSFPVEPLQGGESPSPVR